MFTLVVFKLRNFELEEASSGRGVQARAALERSYVNMPCSEKIQTKYP